jgi:hypothetical protein
VKLSSEGGYYQGRGRLIFVKAMLGLVGFPEQSYIHSPSPTAIKVQCLHAQYAFMIVLRCSYSHKVLPIHPTTCTGSRFIPLLILNVSNRWEVSGLHHAPAALPLEKKPVPPEDAGWAPEPVWTSLSKEKSLAHTGI